jgi:hypothetical protein
MHRLWREVAIGLPDGERSFGDIERAALVRDVHDSRAGADTCNDAFHDAGEVVAEAEISGECDD